VRHHVWSRSPTGGARPIWSPMRPWSRVSQRERTPRYVARRCSRGASVRRSTARVATAGVGSSPGSGDCSGWPPIKPAGPDLRSPRSAATNHTVRREGNPCPLNHCHQHRTGGATPRAPLFRCSAVIWSSHGAVRHVDDGGVRGRDLRGGRGYLPPSITGIFGRKHAGSAGGDACVVG
jgi:hypothetical protein